MRLINNFGRDQYPCFSNHTGRYSGAFPDRSALTNWIPPYENTTITGPYGFFRDFYMTGNPADWFDPSVAGRVTNNCVMPGGVSFGPYPVIKWTCNSVLYPSDNEITS